MSEPLQEAPEMVDVTDEIFTVFGNGWLGQQALCIARHESGLQPWKVGYNKKNGMVLSRDRGVFQINDAAHPEVSDAQAFNPVFNIEWAYRTRLHDQNWHQWTTAPLCHTY